MGKMNKRKREKVGRKKRWTEGRDKRGEESRWVKRWIGEEVDRERGGRREEDEWEEGVDGEKGWTGKKPSA